MRPFGHDTDEELLAAMMRKVLARDCPSGYGYLHVGQPLGRQGPWLTIDLKIDLTPDEWALCQRLVEEEA